jgi:predicted RNA-binding protein with PIN domain
VIHQLPPVLNQAKLEDRRLGFVRFIEQHAPQGSANNRVTIVFDGQEDIWGGMASSTAEVVFSRGESADEKIKKIVAGSAHAKSIVVVSDDRDIQYAVRALGARAVGVKEFLNQARASGRKKFSAPTDLKETKRGAPKPGARETEKYIPRTDEFNITAEFEKIWLKPKKGPGG